MGIKASSSRSLSQMGGARSMIQVGQRCGAAGIISVANSPNGGNYYTCHQRMVFPYGADAIQLVYPNFCNAANSVGETSLPPSMFTASGVTYSGGTSYAVGDVDTFTLTSSTGIAAVKVMITAVSSGVPAQAQIVDGGLYKPYLQPVLRRLPQPAAAPAPLPHSLGKRVQWVRISASSRYGIL